ncbi:MAG: PAS domain S-box protein [Elusimicrobiota bacterium]|nr:PAS domain S-box protein [Elusimicrobiota bacterium]
MAAMTNAKRRASPAIASGFRALYERSPIGIAELDDDGRFLHANTALQRMLGLSEVELRRRKFNDVTHADDAAECAVRFGSLVRREIDHFEIEKRFLRKDGGIVWTHTVVTAIRTKTRSRGMICMTIDVTERRRAQEELGRLRLELEERIEARTSELSFNAAMLAAQQESSPDGLLVVDAEGRIIARNKRFARMWAIPETVLATGSDEQAIASVLSMLVSPEDFLARVRQLYDHPDERSTDELFLRDGRVFERYSSPVRGEDGRLYGRVWHFRDTTERVRHDNEIREKTEALARSNAELELYAYAASHDLSAPLSRILSFAGLLQERVKGKLAADELDLLARMRKSAAAALKLVSDMLTLSRVGRDPLPHESVDLGSLLGEVKAELAAELARAGARIEAGRLPVLRAHMIPLHNLLLNLLSNALKFRSPDRPCVVRVESRRDGDAVELTVADNGIGFDQGYAEKIFQPFLRLHTSSEYEGSGIGLAICRRVAQRYGGSLTAAGEEGKGAVFTLRLPASMLAA